MSSEKSFYVKTLATNRGSPRMRLSIYYQLSAMIILSNIATAVWINVCRTDLNRPSFTLGGVAVNVTIASLIREGHVKNILFWLFARVPRSLPLVVRRAAANLYQMGGIHSGSGLSTGVWLIAFNVAAVQNLPRQLKPDLETKLTLALGLIMNGLLTIMLFTSMPFLRSRFHNSWELVHRTIGWALLLLFWVFFILYNVFEERGTPKRAEVVLQRILRDPKLYLLIITTFCVFSSWCQVRRVRVTRHEVLSSHAMRLHFDYARVGPCKTPRFSHKPLSEWHSFASIPEKSATGYSVVVANAGDWTSKLISDPPAHLYVRGSPARGVLYMARLFKSVLCIATGAGIAPMLGLLTSPPTHLRFFWSVANPIATFGRGIYSTVLRSDPEALVWDTRLSGRPDIVAEAVKIYEKGGIEAVFVISNARITGQVIHGLQSRGIPTFGPNFDS